MLSSGIDNFIFTTAQPEQLIAGALRLIRKRWPNVLMGIDEKPYRRFRGKFQKDELPPAQGDVVVARSQAMVKHWQKNGYQSLRDGEGPFGILYETRRAIDYDLERVTQPREDPHGIQPPDPYAASLSAPWIVVVNVVTPGRPENDPFSKWVYEALCRACRESAR